MREFFLFDFSGEKRELEWPKPEQLLREVSSARESVLGTMFYYAPIDAAGIEAMARPYFAQIKSPADLPKVIASLKQGAVAAELGKHVKYKREIDEFGVDKTKGEPLDLGWAYFLRVLCDRAFPRAAKKKPTSPILLAANCGGWQVVKKALPGKATDDEVLAALVGMYASISRKTEELAAKDYVSYSAFMNKVFSAIPERKSFSRLPDALRAAAEADITPFARDEKLLRELLFERAFARCGFTPYVSTETINGLYPKLKIPKPRGRMPKK
ncbi:Uncharacterised protein [Candidatus Norongarragalina meridionalis]|nr:Uncharacterised protein [Candidatus Norongarragalina meridionalis]